MSIALAARASRRVIATALALLIALAASAPALELLPERGALAIDQSLLDLLTDRRVMCVAAHPDDEDGATLAYLRRKLGVNAITLFATRGEGGQNEISSALYEELAVIRTEECVRAAAVLDTGLAFLDFPDFGFSKSADETYKFWGGVDEVTLRMARAIWTHRPHVIITNHDTTSGHGHHQVCGRAVLAAWDATRAGVGLEPLIAEGLQPWLPEAVFVRVFADDAEATAAATENAVAIPVGEFDLRRGMTYAEMAQAALELHRSQGRWERDLGLAQPPNLYERVRVSRDDYGLGLFGQKAPPWLEPDSVLDVTRRQVLWARDLGEPSMVCTFLGRALDLARVVFATPTREQADELARVEAALVRALGLRLEVVALDPELDLVDPMEIRVRYALTGSVPLSAPIFDVEATDEGAYEFEQVAVEAGASGRLMRHDHGEVVLRGRPLAPRATQPAAATLRTRRAGVPVATVVAHFEVADYETRVSARVPVMFDIVEPIELKLASPLQVVRPGAEGAISIGIKASARGVVRGRLTASGHVNVAREFTVSGDGGRTAVLLPFVIPAAATASDLVIEIAVAAASDLAPTRPLIASARQILRVVDARITGDPLVGVVHTYDDSLEMALDALGARHQRLDEDQVHGGDLAKFDIICLDLRSYLDRPDVVEASSRLIDYAKNGGVLICFYNKLFEWNPGSRESPGAGFAPYPLVLGTQRVTDESAPVELLAAAHPLLSLPNRIVVGDFNGWVQERGLYYPEKYASEFTEILACNDPGEPPLRGGLLHAYVGQGQYVYTSMVWYRQWRAGQPGSFRVLANMLSLPRAPRED